MKDGHRHVEGCREEDSSDLLYQMKLQAKDNKDKPKATNCAHKIKRLKGLKCFSVFLMLRGWALCQQSVFIGQTQVFFLPKPIWCFGGSP